MEAKGKSFTCQYRILYKVAKGKLSVDKKKSKVSIYYFLDVAATGFLFSRQQGELWVSHGGL